MPAPPGGAGGARIGCGTGCDGTPDIGDTSANRLSAKTGTGDAKLGLGSPKGLNATPVGCPPAKRKARNTV